ncbi:MAG: ATPase [Prevotellaceae bacterium]|jgi:N-acetylglucosamine kinase-like BadF-type ATPase|nr:ATPase [Prevotellaceae bacterium]
MTLIADSGSTKTAWCLTDGQDYSTQFLTAGINPFYTGYKNIIAELSGLAGQFSQTVNAVYFYGAGVASPEKAALMKQCFREVFPTATAEVYTDLLGAARALCGCTPGIAGILGTGSNSCFYDGQHIADTVPPCGFILGDEGSGAALGKQLVADFLQRRLPQELHHAFQEHSKLTKDEILEQVYRKPFPNRFLASFTTFLHQHQKHSYIHDLLHKSFDNFLTRHIMHYDYARYPLHLLGSVALYFQHIIKETAGARNIQLGKIEKTALPGLLLYHKKHRP